MIIHTLNNISNIIALFIFINDNIEYFPNETIFKIFIFDDNNLTNNNKSIKNKTYDLDIFSFKNIFKLLLYNNNNSIEQHFTSLNKSNVNDIDIVDFIFLLKSNNIFNNDTFTNNTILYSSILDHVLNYTNPPSSKTDITIQKAFVSQIYCEDCDFIIDCSNLYSIKDICVYMHNIVNYKYINYIYYIQDIINILIILIYIIFLYGFIYYLFCIVLKK